ncbi:MAG: DUF1987 domain-containing protein [Bacteroidales bacterium]|nr:DUF1987 domain-containing protein [Bacteroidales bacterium]MBS3775936.1 DUF1987 domain-containing protein [Bacteroidales bacterium]
MENLSIEETIKTPGVHFDAQNGVLKMNGRAIPENPEDFFTDIMEWLFGYFKNPLNETVVHVQLEYINSGSSKFILEFFNVLEEKHQNGHYAKVNWYYEEDDEAVYDLGKHYQSILDLPFELIEIY